MLGWLGLLIISAASLGCQITGLLRVKTLPAHGFFGGAEGEITPARPQPPIFSLGAAAPTCHRAVRPPQMVSPF